MRKITKQAAQAFINNCNFCSGNTTVTSLNGHTIMSLYGNVIAVNDHGVLTVTLAGWNTCTTRERLNGLLLAMGLSCGFSQRQHEAYFCDTPIDPDDSIIVNQ